MENTSILIVDDHTLVRDTWKHLLEADPRFTVSACCGSGEDAIELAEKFRPDVILMDINLPGMNGIDATELIKKVSPLSKVIGVSYYTQPSYMRKIMTKGAMGYVTKNSRKEELIRAITEVKKGNRYICEEVKNILVDQSMSDEDPSHGMNSLSQRELEIIEYISQGLSSKEIANRLSISVKTVEVHRYNILRKLNLKNSVSLINFIHSHRGV